MTHDEALEKLRKMVGPTGEILETAAGAVLATVVTVGGRPLVIDTSGVNREELLAHVTRRVNGLPYAAALERLRPLVQAPDREPAVWFVDSGVGKPAFVVGDARGDGTLNQRTTGDSWLAAIEKLEGRRAAKPVRFSIDDNGPRLQLSSADLVMCSEALLIASATRAGWNTPETHDVVMKLNAHAGTVRERERVRRETDAALHPNGRCGCGGEGKCGWCRRTEAAIVAEEGRSPTFIEVHKVNRPKRVFTTGEWYRVTRGDDHSGRVGEIIGFDPPTSNNGAPFEQKVIRLRFANPSGYGSFAPDELEFARHTPPVEDGPVEPAPPSTFASGLPETVKPRPRPAADAPGLGDRVRCTADVISKGRTGKVSAIEPGYGALQVTFDSGGVGWVPRDDLEILPAEVPPAAPPAETQPFKEGDRVVVVNDGPSKSRFGTIAAFDRLRARVNLDGGAIAWFGFLDLARMPPNPKPLFTEGQRVIVTPDDGVASGAIGTVESIEVTSNGQKFTYGVRYTLNVSGKAHFFAHELKEAPAERPRCPTGGRHGEYEVCPVCDVPGML